MAYTPYPVSWQPLNGGGTGDGVDAAYVDDAIDARIDALVDSAPGTLDTLNELAASLGDDPNLAATIATALTTKAPATRSFAGLTLEADRTAGTVLTALGLAPLVPQVILTDLSTDIASPGVFAKLFVPSEWAGLRILQAVLAVDTPSSTGVLSMQVNRRLSNGTAVPVLSTEVTVDQGERNSYTATTPGAVNVSANTLSAGELVEFELTEVGSGARGAIGIIQIGPA